MTRLAALLLGASLLFWPHQPAPQPIGGQVSIVALGDSITWGSNSSDGNGYRGPLADLFSGAGVRWLFAGEQTHGTMPDNNSEGWPGQTIAQLQARVLSVMADPPLYRPPAYVLLDAGTNDARTGRTLPQMQADLTVLLGALLAGGPHLRVVLAQITLTTSAIKAAQDVEQAFDDWLPTLVGPRVRVVDMRGVQLGDGIHPTDAGYVDMGQRWFAALQAWRGA